jgi:hypothetical protein
VFAGRKVVEGALELESLDTAIAVAVSPSKRRAVLRVQNMGMCGGDDRLGVTVGERLCESLTDKGLVE